MPPKTRNLTGGNWLFPAPSAASVPRMGFLPGLPPGHDDAPWGRSDRRAVLRPPPGNGILRPLQHAGRRFRAGDFYCAARCAATSVRTQADVKRKLPGIKQQLAALGIRTVSPVWVQLASPEKLRGIAGNHALGVTVSRGEEVIDLLVLQDLPLLKFGTTVAHETMHSYMTQNGFGQVPARIAEGMCQLLAYAWVIRQDGILAAAERRQIEENPDPIYGDGFRQAHEAVRRVGVRRTLATVKQQHRFP